MTQEATRLSPLRPSHPLSTPPRARAPSLTRNTQSSMLLHLYKIGDVGGGRGLTYLSHIRLRIPFCHRQFFTHHCFLKSAHAHAAVCACGRSLLCCTPQSCLPGPLLTWALPSRHGHQVADSSVLPQAPAPWKLCAWPSGPAPRVAPHVCLRGISGSQVMRTFNFSRICQTNFPELTEQPGFHQQHLKPPSAPIRAATGRSHCFWILPF